MLPDGDQLVTPVPEEALFIRRLAEEDMGCLPGFRECYIALRYTGGTPVV